MPEWEERKSLLAQRRVESVRLLTVLLNRVKLASQKVDPSLGIKDESFSETVFKDIQQELINSLYRTHKELTQTDSCMQLESLRKIQRKCKKMLHKKVKFKTHHTSMAAPDGTPHDGSPLQETFQRRGDERKLMLRREMDADVRGCPLFPLEIIQTNPFSDTFCGGEPRRGC
ncbi:PREDICTED: uncharacterized protein LOC102105933 isoform X4 [Pseudopodoces humilis]|uniref:uncharacterized protein LOC102105933 isoform X4 n=1 Tax=Pseudopodoces humilis TaxID=181119 RepID=UPI0006B6C333|nr:PREDICTED: uncharacterized protein LOC102105933 isoform X4 [Pseudopodoces humilis]